MAVGEDTQLDAPVTPAPVFAYRALKAAFWGEQDSPDTKTKSAAGLAPKTSESIRLKPPHQPQISIHLSPSQKRKRAALSQTSPTKSILRTPGVLTPRRAMLRDVTVTFKDLRKSASPELSYKGTIPQQPMRADIQAGKENLYFAPTKQTTSGKSVTGHANTKSSSELATSANPPNQPSKSVAHPAPPRHEPLARPPALEDNAPAAFDAEAYMHATEQEMKKLIKYGQKMREYARRSDDENNKLRALLEEARRENQQLRAQLESSKTAEAAPEAKESPERHIRTKEERPTARSQTLERSSSTDERERARRHRQPDDFEPLDLDIRQIPPSKKHDRNPAPSSSKRPLSGPEPEPEPETMTHPPLPSMSTSIAKPSPKKPRREEYEHEHERDVAHALPPRPVANGATRLAPDRLAAARARVRKKLELRKASGDGAELGAKVDTSQVDWAAL